MAHLARRMHIYMALVGLSLLVMAISESPAVITWLLSPGAAQPPALLLLPHAIRG